MTASDARWTPSYMSDNVTMIPIVRIFCENNSCRHWRQSHPNSKPSHPFVPKTHHSIGVRLGRKPKNRPNFPLCHLTGNGQWQTSLCCRCSEWMQRTCESSWRNTTTTMNCDCSACQTRPSRTRVSLGATRYVLPNGIQHLNGLFSTLASVSAVWDCRWTPVLEQKVPFLCLFGHF